MAEYALYLKAHIFLHIPLPDNVTHNEYVFITTNQIIKYNKLLKQRSITSRKEEYEFPSNIPIYGVQTCPYLRFLEENKTGKGQTTKF